jgi:methanogen homoisocitrate dehydrogenase
MIKICAIAGDGVGQELMEPTIDILDKIGLKADFNLETAGYEAYLQTGSSLPEETLIKAKSSNLVLFGAVTTPPNIVGYKSAILKLRSELELFANIRPAKTINGITKYVKPFDLVIIRENTECLYSGIERDYGERKITERVITRDACERIIDFSINFAVNNNRNDITLAHKANVLRLSDGYFRELYLEKARIHSETNEKVLTFNEMLIDTMAMRLVLNPEQFNLIITSNLFGDILSDLTAGIMGSLGMAASANIGSKYALFEPVHGSAPDIAGKNIVNPLGMLYSSKLMLEYLNEHELANCLEFAINLSLEKNIKTKDIGGNCTTKEVFNFIKNQL